MSLKKEMLFEIIPKLTEITLDSVSDCLSAENGFLEIIQGNALEASKNDFLLLVEKTNQLIQNQLVYLGVLENLSSVMDPCCRQVSTETGKRREQLFLEAKTVSEKLQQYKVS